MFKLFKKKKKDSSTVLPPPLPPEELPEKPKGDLPPIIPEQEPQEDVDIPELEFPAMPKEELAEEEEILPPKPKDFAVKKPLPKFESGVPTVFDKTIEEELPSKKIIRPRLQPIFVGVDDYKLIINNTNIIRSKLLEAEDFAKKLNHLKHKESQILDKWQSRIEDIDKKMNYIDKLVSKAQG
ncbi:hypothetical protein JW851_02685 [Candidatus Woesearchaeota archaeon]|nr:hypothetical protein [Candidatus Woesearchaeota archaeon]